MIKLVLYEFRKTCNQVAILAIIALIILSSADTLIFYLNPNISIISSGGEKIKGLKSFKELKKQSKDIEGIIDQEYLNSLIKKYNSSNEKKYYNSSSEFPESKYIFPNYFINFIHYSENMSNFYVDLDFEFMKSEKEFYNQYRKSVSNLIMKNNQNKGLFKYTDKQMNVINDKIENIKTPLKVEYYYGLSVFIWKYGAQYWFVLIVISFALSSIFSKDSNNGISELSLSSTYGRKKNMNSRIIAGNIFATLIYIIFVSTLLIINGLLGSLHGWKQSAQLFWHSCLYNINLGVAILIMLVLGLLGILVIANLVMLLSIKIKNAKVTTVISLSSVWGLVKLTQTTNSLQLQLNPIHFGTRFTISNIIDYEVYYFIGNRMIPYSIIILLLVFIYIIIIRFLTIKSYKKYKLH